MYEQGQVFVFDGIIALLIILVIIWVAVSMEMSMINEFKDTNEHKIEAKKEYEKVKGERNEAKWISTIIGSID